MLARRKRKVWQQLAVTNLPTILVQSDSSNVSGGTSRNTSPHGIGHLRLDTVTEVSEPPSHRSSFSMERRSFSMERRSLSRQKSMDISTYDYIVSPNSSLDKGSPKDSLDKVSPSNSLDKADVAPDRENSSSKRSPRQSSRDSLYRYVNNLSLDLPTKKSLDRTDSNISDNVFTEPSSATDRVPRQSSRDSLYRHVTSLNVDLAARQSLEIPEIISNDVNRDSLPRIPSPKASESVEKSDNRRTHVDTDDSVNLPRIMFRHSPHRSSTSSVELASKDIQHDDIIRDDDVFNVAQLSKGSLDQRSGRKSPINVDISSELESLPRLQDSPSLVSIQYSHGENRSRTISTPTELLSRTPPPIQKPKPLIPKFASVPAISVVDYDDPNSPKSVDQAFDNHNSGGDNLSSHPTFSSENCSEDDVVKGNKEDCTVTARNCHVTSEINYESSNDFYSASEPSSTENQGNEEPFQSTSKEALNSANRVVHTTERTSLNSRMVGVDTRLKIEDSESNISCSSEKSSRASSVSDKKSEDSHRPTELELNRTSGNTESGRASAVKSSLSNGGVLVFANSGKQKSSSFSDSKCTESPTKKSPTKSPKTIKEFLLKLTSGIDLSPEEKSPMSSVNKNPNLISTSVRSARSKILQQRVEESKVRRTRQNSSESPKISFEANNNGTSVMGENVNGSLVTHPNSAFSKLGRLRNILGSSSSANSSKERKQDVETLKGVVCETSFCNMEPHGTAVVGVKHAPQPERTSSTTIIVGDSVFYTAGITVKDSERLETALSELTSEPDTYSKLTDTKPVSKEALALSLKVIDVSAEHSPSVPTISTEHSTPALSVGSHNATIPVGKGQHAETVLQERTHPLNYETTERPCVSPGEDRENIDSIRPRFLPKGYSVESSGFEDEADQLRASPEKSIVNESRRLLCKECMVNRIDQPILEGSFSSTSGGSHSEVKEGTDKEGSRRESREHHSSRHSSDVRTPDYNSLSVSHLGVAPLHSTPVDGEDARKNHYEYLIQQITAIRRDLKQQEEKMRRYIDDRLQEVGGTHLNNKHYRRLR